MIRRLVITGVLTLAAGATLAGCSDGGEKAEAPPAAGTASSTRQAGGPEVQWATKVCNAVKTGGLNLQMPSIDPKDAAKSKENIVTFLGDLSTQLKTLGTNLNNVGAPPVPGTKDDFDKAIKNLGTSQEAVDKAATQLRKAKVTDQTSFQKEITKVGQTMSRFSAYQGPTGDLIANPQLKAAFVKAPGCESIAPA